MSGSAHEEPRDAAVDPEARALFEDAVSRVGALLFALPRPAADEEIAAAVGAPPPSKRRRGRPRRRVLEEQAETPSPAPDPDAVLRELAIRFRAVGVDLVRGARGVSLQTRPEHGDMLRRVLEPPQRRADLTLPQMRVLAAVAVHQPATRGEIAHVLVQSEVSPDILDALEERGFVRPGPRRMTPGRPATWVTTPLFLDHFGLATPEDIPGLAEMHAAGMLDRERLEREMRATRLAREE